MIAIWCYHIMSDGIAKITWDDPQTNERREFLLLEGATASIGRSPDNDISIPERHVSRQQAVITFRDGVFIISDLGSANGTFVNDTRLSTPTPLVHGDKIRLYVPVLEFSAVVSEEEQEVVRRTGTIIVPKVGSGRPRLVITAGAQEGKEYVLFEDKITIGRQTTDTEWDIALQDRAISRPHCRLSLKEGAWALMDLGSANGTNLNGNMVTAQPVALKDGDVIAVGSTTLIFRFSREN
jgi:pSer/pThr/pTyr-binding forkhead associated (FHA) protein